MSHNLQEHEEIKTKSDKCEDNEKPPLEDCSNKDVEYPIKGKSLVKWRGATKERYILYKMSY